MREGGRNRRARDSTNVYLKAVSTSLLLEKPYRSKGVCLFHTHPSDVEVLDGVVPRALAQPPETPRRPETK